MLGFVPGIDWVATRRSYQPLRVEAAPASRKGLDLKGVAWKGLIGIVRAKIIRDAEQKHRIPWTKSVQWVRDQNAVLVKEEEALTNPEVDYPEYFLQRFHSYEDGNLDVMAVEELDAATNALACRLYEPEIVSGDWEYPEASTELRKQFLEQIGSYQSLYGGVVEPRRILDIGGSAIHSTEPLLEYFPNAKVTVVDLSPKFLALGVVRGRQKGLLDRINFLHANAEYLDQFIPNGSVDLVCASFLLHELPTTATKYFLKQALQALKPGAGLAITDNDPVHDAKIPKLVLGMHYLTEPWKGQYSKLDVQALLEELGFVDVVINQINRKHRAILARKPD